MNIENKTVPVTGSTDGVGRLVARRLADQGARVLIHGRDRTRSEQLLKEIRAAHRGSAAFLPADFSAPEVLPAPALKVAREIAALPAGAVALSRALMRGATDELLARIDQEAKIFSERLNSPEAKVAFEAFFARKR